MLAYSPRYVSTTKKEQKRPSTVSALAQQIIPLMYCEKGEPIVHRTEGG